MKQETKMIILLLFLPPMLGELLSGSLPPVPFFTGGIIFLVLLYGCGTLLIREAKARWNLHWSVIFLAVAYGILEEGTMVQSFFNVGHVDLGVLSGYGMYLGVQWPWSIALTVYHATVSTLIPIVIVEYLYPGYKKPLLKRRGILLCSAGFIFIIVFFLAVALQELPPYQGYHFNSLLNIVTLAVVGLLIWLAYTYRESRIVTRTRVLSPFMFGFIGFWFLPLNLFPPNILAGMQVSGVVTIFLQMIWVFLILIFVFYQICNINTTKRHLVSLVFGCILFLVVLTPLQEFGAAQNPDPTVGMTLIGAISLILLIIWRRKVLKSEQTTSNG